MRIEYGLIIISVRDMLSGIDEHDSRRECIKCQSSGSRMRVFFLGYGNKAKLEVEEAEISEEVSKEIRGLTGSDDFLLSLFP